MFFKCFSDCRCVQNNSDDSSDWLSISQCSFFLQFVFFSILLTFTTLLWVQFLEYLIIFSNYEHTHKVEDKEVET